MCSVVKFRFPHSHSKINTFQNIFHLVRLPSPASTKRNLFFTQILHSHRADFTENRYNKNNITQTICGVIPGQYRTKSVWRLCTPSACKFPFRACLVSSRTHLACIFSEIFRENTRKSTKDFLRFSLHRILSHSCVSSCPGSSFSLTGTISYW